MHTSHKRRAICNALYRLGLHTPPRAIVHSLQEQGILVEETLVRAVLLEMLKETTRARNVRAARPIPTHAVRRRPQGFPGKRENR